MSHLPSNIHFTSRHEDGVELDILAGGDLARSDGFLAIVGHVLVVLERGQAIHHVLLILYTINLFFLKSVRLSIILPSKLNTTKNGYGTIGYR